MAGGDLRNPITGYHEHGEIKVEVAASTQGVVITLKGSSINARIELAPNEAMTFGNGIVRAAAFSQGGQDHDA